MSRKTKLGFILILVMILAFSANILAQGNNDEIYSIEKQTERLHELRELLNSPDFTHSMPLNANGEPIEVPNINLIAPPADRNGHFMIGLEIDHTGLGFEDTDALKELTGQKVPDEIINFIISFTGISRDQAEIGYSITLPISRLPADAYISRICPVWGDDRFPQKNDETYETSRQGGFNNE